MDNQEMLNIISPYLPHNLRVIDSMGRIVYLRGISLNALSSLFVRLNDKDVCVSLGGIPKLILRPLSDLPDSELFEKWNNEHDIELRYGKRILIDVKTAYTIDVIGYPLQFITELYKNHYDIHNLIEQGLAIDINTL